MIEAVGLTKSFADRKSGRFNAVENVSFQVRPGVILGVLGPNGAGKTTLLRLLSTILTPTAGTARICGIDAVKDPAGVRACTGFLTGATALYERLTPREVVAYFADLQGLPAGERDRRIDRVFSELEIHGFADRRCDRLSTGEKQRVNIARAIVHSPPVLFFDEPTAGLDVLAARSVIRFIRRCRDEGHAILFSTHIMSEVETLCDRIALIYRGRIVAVGTLQELRERTGQTAFESIFLKLIGEEA